MPSSMRGLSLNIKYTEYIYIYYIFEYIKVYDYRISDKEEPTSIAVLHLS